MKTKSISGDCQVKVKNKFLKCCRVHTVYTDTEALATLQLADYLVSNATVKRCVMSRRQKKGRLFTSRTVVGSLFQMTGTTELKAQLPYLVWVRGAWSRGRVNERSDIDEPECWLEMSWRRYSGWEVVCVLYARVASLKSIRWGTRSQCNDLTGWPQTLKTWNTWGFFWTWKTPGILGATSGKNCNKRKYF